MQLLRRLLVHITVLSLMIAFGATPGRAEDRLVLPTDLRIIEEQAFFGDSGLGEVILPEGIKAIGANAFAESTLSAINLPASLISIADNALPSPCTVTVAAPEGTYAYGWAVSQGYIIPDEDFAVVPVLNVGELTEENGVPVWQHILCDGEIELEFTVIAPGDWVAEWDEDAVTTAEQYSNKLVLCLEDNETGFVRETTVTFTCDDMTVSYLLRQEPMAVLLSPTDLYPGIVYDHEASFPCYGGEDIPLVWTAVPGAVRYDLMIHRYGYSGDGGIWSLAEIDQPATDGDTVALTLTRELLDGYDVQDCMGVSLLAYDAYGNAYGSGYYCFRWVRDFDSLEYDFYYGRDGKYDFSYDWPYDSGEITGVVLTHYHGTDAEVHVPTVFGGYPVCSLNQTFSFNTNITDVVIPENVEIGLWPFFRCENLTHISLPNTLKRIDGGGAFGECVSLTEIDIPNGVTYLSGFEGCTGLTSIDIPDSVTEIGPWAFQDCSGLTEITIPASVREIGEMAFDGCTALSTIRGETGSYAQTWAEENGYAFIGLSEE